MSRLATRARVIPRAFANCFLGRTGPPEGPVKRVLIAHHLLLGDTLMLSPLIAKLRAIHPLAEIDLLTQPAFAGLYSGRPWGVRALPWAPSDTPSLQSIFAASHYDLAFVPGDNRYSWLARAAGARWVVAHGGDRPGWKNFTVDELRPFRSTAGAWGDIVADLIDGPAPAAYRPSDWPAPAAEAFERPADAYAVLHVGASTPLKRWRAPRWLGIAEGLERRGITPVFLAGADEKPVVREIDPYGRWRSYAGRLALEQVWHLLAGARVLLAPDTGIAHLGRVIGVPTVALFGPGSSIICGAGDFWRASPYWPVTMPEIACRDQTILFNRDIEWVRRCGRSTSECTQARCMDGIGLAVVDGIIEKALHSVRSTSRGQSASL